MEKNLILFEQQLQKLGIAITQEQKQQLIHYYELLIEWNKVMNLTGITEFEEVMEKHFLDSISLAHFYSLEQKKFRVLDLGTGAGFPGVPLKIMFPQLEVVLMDSLQKRVRFLNEVILELGLSAVTAVHGRAEEMARQKDYREQFDLCVSRAVANLATLSEYCLPFVKQGGYFISYKSKGVKEELASAKKAAFLLGGMVEKVEQFSLGEEHLDRAFVFLKKEKKTPKAYPRKAGTPTKSPLGQN